MEVPQQFIALGITSALGLQAWQLKQLVDIKVQIAELKTTQDDMKKSYKSVVLALGLSLLPLLLAGCSMLDKMLLEPVVTTNQVQTVTHSQP